MYWSAILSPRSRVSRGSRFLPRFRPPAPTELPEEALHRGALLEPEDAELEHLQGLLLLCDGVVIGLGAVARREPGHDLAHLPHDLRLVRLGTDAAAISSAAPISMWPKTFIDHARVVGGDRPAGLGDDVRLGHLLVLQTRCML